MRCDKIVCFCTLATVMFSLGKMSRPQFAVLVSSRKAGLIVEFILFSVLDFLFLEKNILLQFMILSSSLNAVTVLHCQNPVCILTQPFNYRLVIMTGMTNI